MKSVEPEVDKVIARQVLGFARSEGLIGPSAASRRFAISRQHARRLLHGLTRTGHLACVHHAGNERFLVPTREWRACECDGRCSDQIHVLRDDGVRRLFTSLQPRRTWNSRQIASRTSLALGWSRSTLHHRLGRLEEAGLLERFDPGHSDRRLVWFRTKPPLPPAVEILRAGPTHPA